MVKKASFILVLSLVFVFAVPVLVRGCPWAHGFTCMSGAPGAPFIGCSRSCHGYPGGTLVINGFPGTYKPDSVYTITVWHIAGDSILDFNCSVRMGWGTVNAGLITSGFGTVTYSCSVETNGVHAIAPCDSCNFLWNAPPLGTDTVRLYLSYYQGLYESGRSEEWVLVSSELTGVEEQGALSPKYNAFGLRSAGANPVRGSIALAYRADGAGPAELRIYDLRGRLVRSYVLSGYVGLLRWDGRDASGHLIPGGFYFFRLEQGPRCVTYKALLIR